MKKVSKQPVLMMLLFCGFFMMTALSVKAAVLTEGSTFQAASSDETPVQISFTVTKSAGGDSDTPQVYVQGEAITDEQTGDITGYKTAVAEETTGTVTIPATITYEDVTYDVIGIGQSAFEGLGTKSINEDETETTPLPSDTPETTKEPQGVTAVVLPASVKEIKDYAFKNTDIDSINLTNVSVIGIQAFSETGFMTSVVLGENLTELKEGVFQRSALETIELPAGITAIPDNGFKACANLESITRISGGTGITKIGSTAFANCIKLKEVPDFSKVTSIGEQGFRSCTKLEEIAFGKNTNNASIAIGNEAFMFCVEMRRMKFYSPEISFGEKAFDFGGATIDGVVANNIYLYQQSEDQNYDSLTQKLTEAYENSDTQIQIKYIPYVPEMKVIYGENIFAAEGTEEAVLNNIVTQETSNLKWVVNTVVPGTMASKKALLNGEIINTQEDTSLSISLIDEDFKEDEDKGVIQTYSRIKIGLMKRQLAFDPTNPVECNTKDYDGTKEIAVASGWVPTFTNQVGTDQISIKEESNGSGQILAEASSADVSDSYNVSISLNGYVLTGDNSQYYEIPVSYTYEGLTGLINKKTGYVAYTSTPTGMNYTGKAYERKETEAAVLYTDSTMTKTTGETEYTYEYRKTSESSNDAAWTKNLPVQADTYQVRVTADSLNYKGTATASLVIGKASQSIKIRYCDLDGNYFDDSQTEAPIEGSTLKLQVWVEHSNYAGEQKETQDSYPTLETLGINIDKPAGIKSLGTLETTDVPGIYECEVVLEDTLTSLQVTNGINIEASINDRSSLINYSGITAKTVSQILTVQKKYNVNMSLTSNQTGEEMTYGDSLELTAAIRKVDSTKNANITGDVTFYQGNTVLGTVGLKKTGEEMTASLTINKGANGRPKLQVDTNAYSFRAEYSGDASYAANVIGEDAALQIKVVKKPIVVTMQLKEGTYHKKGNGDQYIRVGDDMPTCEFIWNGFAENDNWNNSKVDNVEPTVTWQPDNSNEESEYATATLSNTQDLFKNYIVDETQSSIYVVFSIEPIDLSDNQVVDTQGTHVVYHGETWYNSDIIITPSEESKANGLTHIAVTDKENTAPESDAYSDKIVINQETTAEEDGEKTIYLYLKKTGTDVAQKIITIPYHLDKTAPSLTDWEVDEYKVTEDHIDYETKMNDVGYYYMLLAKKSDDIVKNGVTENDLLSRGETAESNYRNVEITDLDNDGQGSISETFDNLDYNTQYVLYLMFADKAGNRAAIDNKVILEQEFTTGKIALAGRVTITGTPTIGQTLKASTTGITSKEPGTYSYQWYRDKEAITGADKESYVLTSEDKGKTISVTVSAQNYIQTLTATLANKINKAVLECKDTPVVSGTYGMKLSEYTIQNLKVTSGDKTIDGVWKLEDSALDDVPTVLNSQGNNAVVYTLKFIPDNKEDYNTYTTEFTPTVTPRTVIITASVKDKIYNNKPLADCTLTVSNLLGQDKITAYYSSAKFTTTSCGMKKQVIIEGIGLQGTGCENYKVPSTKMTVTGNIIKVDPQSLTLNKSKATLAAGNTLQLSKFIKPANTTITSVIWESANKKVAKISENGLVTAVGPGTVKITCTTMDSPIKTASCMITVTPGQVKNIKATIKQTKIKLRWDKQPGVKGYRVFYYNSSTRKWITVKTITSNTPALNVIKLSKNRKYKFKIRSYYKKGKKTQWGKMSQSKTFKTKR